MTTSRRTTLDAGAIACLAAIVMGGPAFSAEDATALIADALRAAPPNIRDTATVSDLEGNILRPGPGDYTCFPAPQGVAGPMCMDGEWRRWMQAWMHHEPFTASRVGISYMMAGDSSDGGASNIDPAAGTPTADNDWVVEGPHVMMIVPDPAALEGLPTTLDTDGPYVMWSGTPYAHIMIPIDNRPEQRAITN
ncbi:MAG: hypothetical protein R3D28_22555 [Geminicoccaceae bacterium]|nr:hypothetical protein [Geminicoccaceae bacterium]